MGSTSKDISFTVFKGSPDRRIVKGTTHREGLKGDEVLIRITHSSLCGTDEHYLSTDMVLGHEGAGVIEQIGSEVKGLAMYVSLSIPPKKPNLQSHTQTTTNT